MAFAKKYTYVIGIDEVGRGPLAGPVVVCAVAIPRLHRYARRQDCRQAAGLAKHCGQVRTLRPTMLAPGVPLRDSKKLTALQRTAWATALKSDHRIYYSIASVTPSIIDRINVTQAANRAATRALIKVLASLPASCRVEVFLDGGIYLRETRNMKNEKLGKPKSTFLYDDNERNFRFTSTTVIKGDENIPAISFASIIAKQHRDALMRRAHKKYPFYGFDRHVGYGTKKHISAIRENGHSPIHRKSFLKKIV